MKAAARASGKGLPLWHGRGAVGAPAPPRGETHHGFALGAGQADPAWKRWIDCDYEGLCVFFAFVPGRTGIRTSRSVRS